MSIILKIAGIAIICVVLCLFVSKQNKDIAVVISIAACCGIFVYAAHYFEAVLTYIDELVSFANLNAGFFEVLLQAVGIGLITEITMLICADSGNSALGKTVQLVGSGAILWCSLPLFSSLMELLSKILGEA